MNYKQYLLVKLAEECNEVAQMTIKTMLFGEQSVDPRESTGETNVQKLRKELMDVVAVMEELHNLVPEFDQEVDEVYVLGKQKKLQDYYLVFKGESDNAN